MGIQFETELYMPVKMFLEAQGYEVKGEVNTCDLVAVREGEVVVVELKRSFTLPLLYQGIERQKLTDDVYLAVENTHRRASKWLAAKQLCQKLGIGLLIVTFGLRNPIVEVLYDPLPYQPRRNRQRRSLLLKEFHKRQGDPNLGGSNRRPLMTSYRQDALKVAYYLQVLGPTPVKKLRQLTELTNVSSILQKNYYGWFTRESRGTYKLVDKGQQALSEFDSILDDLSLKK